MSFLDLFGAHARLERARDCAGGSGLASVAPARHAARVVATHAYRDVPRANGFEPVDRPPPALEAERRLPQLPARRREAFAPAQAELTLMRWNPLTVRRVTMPLATLGGRLAARP